MYFNYWYSSVVIYISDSIIIPHTESKLSSHTGCNISHLFGHILLRIGEVRRVTLTSPVTNYQEVE